MIRIARAVGRIPEKAEWAPLKVGDTHTAWLACPKCGQRGTLEDHEIAADGSVTPSVMCNDGCDYHESGLLLVGWVAQSNNPEGSRA